MKSKPGSSGNISLRRGGIADGSMAGIYEPRGPRTQKSLARESQSHRRPSPKDRPPSNRILATLPPAEYERLQSYLRLVPLKRGKVLWESNQPIDSVYFPNSGMISLVAVMANGKTVEVGMTGRHGFVGTPVLLGVQSAPFRAVVQIEGYAFQIQSDVLCKILAETPRLEAMLRRYVHVLAMRAAQAVACNSVQIEGYAFQIQSDVLCKILAETPRLEAMLRRYVHVLAMRAAQAVACNCLHKIGERLSCFLAISRHIAGSDSLPFTQEFLAEMLGCRRSSVTPEISSLKSAGAIRCNRGRVYVVNRGELERRACECYETVRRLSDPFLGS